MALELIFQKIENLKKELEPLRPLKKEQLRRLEQKLRLDWNYHSNHIEGNSLTYGETKALILHGITAQNKPMSHHLEVSGHNEAVELLMSIVSKQEDYEITETNIRQIHQIILPKDSYTEAISNDGKKTRKKFTSGKYKTQPNNVTTSTGEIREFTSPEETPAKMKELIEWYKKEKGQDQDPIILATAFHYRFVRIHPFDDGNGRMARILMNLIIMQGGLPPAIIPTERKEEYLNALELADKAGDLDQFTELIAVCVAASLELELKAARGESIEEPDDLDKKVALLEKRMEWGGMDEEVHYLVDIKTLDELLLPTLNQISDYIKTLIEKLNSIGTVNNIFYETNSYSIFYPIQKGRDATRRNQFYREAIKQKKLKLTLKYGNVIIDTSKVILVQIPFIIEQSFFELITPRTNTSIRRRYHQQLTVEEIDMIAREVFDSVYSEIEQLIKENEQKKSPDS